MKNKICRRLTLFSFERSKKERFWSLEVLKICNRSLLCVIVDHELGNPVFWVEILFIRFVKFKSWHDITGTIPDDWGPE